MTAIPIVVGALGTVSNGFEKKNERIGNQRNNRDHLDSSIVVISQNTQKSPGELRRLSLRL